MKELLFTVTETAIVLIDALAQALVDVWVRLGLPLGYHALAAE